MGILTGEFLVDGDERKMARLKFQPSAMVMGTSEVQLSMWLGKTSVAKSVDDRRRVDGDWEALQAAR
jgi:hypothetical protein